MSTESRRPLEDGKRVRYYSLNTEDVMFARKVLEYRQRRREEKERKGQEEQEINANYAARMQTQYGVNAIRPSSMICICCLILKNWYY
ncbi:hypothetical protein [Nostoc sp. CCY0012]|uniref:hypothetical protein n=1 Tax=Nostoc sp. CCY0012 TaxID=1056123 RepID=UPI0039C72998